MAPCVSCEHSKFAVFLASTGQLATPAQIQIAARAQNWSALRFKLLGAANPNTDRGRAYITSYYVDYPQLYLNVPSTQSPQADIASFIADTRVSSLTAPSVVRPYVSSGGSYYLVTGCTPGALTVNLAGSPMANVTTCDTTNHSNIFFAPAGQAVAIQSPGSATLAVPRRFVF